MGIFAQVTDLITSDSICEALCNLTKSNLDLFEDAGAGMYNLPLWDDRLNSLVDENENPEYFQIYPDDHSLDHMWILTNHEGVTDWGAPDSYTTDYQLSDYLTYDLLIIYQVVKDAIDWHRKRKQIRN